MRRVAAALNVAVATVLVAGCHTSAEPPAEAADPPSAPGDARPVLPRPAVGALFLGGTDAHTCTASVVRSTTQNLILTAAHCLASGVPVTFVPGFEDEAAPGDVWTVDAIYLDPRWLTSQDPKADYAFARVSRPVGDPVETVAGQSLALGAAPGRDLGAVTVVGYPLGVGGSPIGCDGVAGMEPEGYPSLHCGGLVDGTSGAPWIQDSTVFGVIGGLDGGGCRDDISYSPPFDAATAALLARAEDGGPGDTAPNSFGSQC
ncbi:trypsin-like peptidase domain-containing protein [Mycobacterium sp. CVI_P3]|uniref:Trypsin-like peptidase domain-containing protein n=1 Tax=Mycobacterium pinniadriaticum TaxID=2994102 RepID=A0ABT3SHV9_9MYCO|nr:trypsin-like peptidase domain-containing protein [Mycobacterium pinniadriaticum]MCX2932187.1 trypsin-like peptidase domain-containing protein [Mycobacterium pinniadriaticum]MCX2938713.1 trypsin-like peptidase domain-containing protein [Mycobacterium pinniadriaticum]